MRTFLAKIAIYMALLTALLGLSLLWVPYERIGGATLLFSLLDKHALLQKAQSPRLIFAGGSNLSFGLDSERIARECRRDVANLGIHGGLGLRYMLDDLRSFVRAGDVIVIVPEYDQFEGSRSYGQQELLCALFDVYPEGKTHIGLRQWIHLSRFLPTYAAGKLVLGARYGLTALSHRKTPRDFGVYDRRAFNRYGDAVAHWNQANTQFAPSVVKGKINLATVSYLNDFHSFLRSKHARALFLYPGFHSTSFGMSSSFITSLDRVLHRSLQIPILSAPERYRLADDLFFNTPYHLNKAGVDLRTEKAIEDLKGFWDENSGNDKTIPGRGNQN